jgi:hypothetical protein
MGIDKNETKTPPDPEEAKQERAPGQATPPRGNPDRDRDSVEKGEEQLGKIAGN